MKLYIVDVGLPIPAEVDTILDTTGFYRDDDRIGQVENLFPAFVDSAILDFDKWYWDYLLVYDFPFVNLMKIVYPLYEGKSVAVYYDPVAGIYNDYMESLLKFLTLRYDLLGNRIQSPVDYETAVDCEFSVKGLYNLDLDKDRLVALQMSGAFRWSNVPQQPIRKIYKLG